MMCMIIVCSHGIFLNKLKSSVLFETDAKSAMTLSIMTFSIMTLGIKGLIVTLSINVDQHKQRSA